jgi:hypothetical protein
MANAHTKRKKKTSLFARNVACGSSGFECDATDAPWAGMIGVTLSCLMS